MGLPSLRDKINAKLSQQALREEDVLYILVEIGKYLERSGPKKGHLGDPENLKLKADDYETIIFFRNWAAHTEKNYGVPAYLLPYFEKALAGDKDGERAILDALKSQLESFANKMGAAIGFSRGDFEYNLRSILSEQPASLPDGTKAGYDDQLVLRKL